MKTKKQDQTLMSLLKVHEISRIICETNMGVLKLQIRKGENEYRFLLDSVPLPKELHKEVYELLYAPEIPQVNVIKEYLNKAETPEFFLKPDTIFIPKHLQDKAAEVFNMPELALKKKGGRPKGSVNKK